jgi:putative methionine-R-sulfoxide reductase with GAF domain
MTLPPSEAASGRPRETTVQPYAGALEAIHRILNREPEADEVLRQTVAVLHDRIEDYAWVGISFVEEDVLVLGPWRGAEGAGAGATEHVVPILYRDRPVASLRVLSHSPEGFGEEEALFLERVATLVSSHCLVAWDTGGVPWSEV